VRRHERLNQDDIKALNRIATPNITDYIIDFYPRSFFRQVTPNHFLSILRYNYSGKINEVMPTVTLLRNILVCRCCEPRKLLLP